jgi:hypothetical protein
MQTEAERERLDHLDAFEAEMNARAAANRDQPIDMTDPTLERSGGVNASIVQADADVAHAVEQAREGDFDPLRQMVDEADLTPEERDEELSSIDRLAAMRAVINKKVDIRLVRMVQDVLTAKCQVCKQTKEGLLFSDRRHMKIYFKDVFLCWEDFVMIAKKTKALGLFESKIASAYFYE